LEIVDINQDIIDNLTEILGVACTKPQIVYHLYIIDTIHEVKGRPVILLRVRVAKLNSSLIRGFCNNSLQLTSLLNYKCHVIEHFYPLEDHEITYFFIYVDIAIFHLTV
jgi:hypothetical protein